MNLKNILVKVSGDLIERKEVLDEIKDLANQNSNKIDLIYGFGTRLSKELDEKGIHYEFRDGIRDTTSKGLKAAFRISEEIREKLEKEFADYNFQLISPVKVINGNITNTNSDEILMKEGKNYDKIIVYALEGKDKSKFIEKFRERVEIKYKK
jgi:acetylglutamate kinase